MDIGISKPFLSKAIFVALVFVACMSMARAEYETFYLSSTNNNGYSGSVVLRGIVPPNHNAGFTSPSGNYYLGQTLTSDYTPSSWNTLLHIRLYAEGTLTSVGYPFGFRVIYKAPLGSARIGAGDYFGGLSYNAWLQGSVGPSTWINTTKGTTYSLVEFNTSGSYSANHILGPGDYIILGYWDDGNSGGYPYNWYISSTLPLTPPQSITFPNPGPKVFGAAPFALGATASSGLPVTYSIVSGGSAATISGSTLTITAAGTVTVRASQPGNAVFTAAPTVDQTFTISKATATVTLSSTSTTFTGLPILVTATTNPPGLNVIITYNGSTTPPTNVGTYTVIGTIDDPRFQGVSP